MVEDHRRIERTRIYTSNGDAMASLDMALYQVFNLDGIEAKARAYEGGGTRSHPH